MPSTTTLRPVMTPPPSPTKDYSDAVFQTASSPGDDYSSGDFSDALIFDSTSLAPTSAEVRSWSRSSSARWTTQLHRRQSRRCTDLEVDVVRRCDLKNTVCPDESNSDDNGGTCEGQF
ncbi:MAG: hypothetical protein R2710_27960 [Acidimicrobiales bacterium]